MPKKTIWALDIGAWSMKVGRARSERDGTVLVDLYDEINYQALEVEDGGKFLSGAREAVEEFSSRYTVGAHDDLCVSVSGSGVFSRFINLPPVPESVDEIIQYEARQQIPFDMDQVVWDYQPVKERHDPWEEVKVGLFALRSEAVDDLMEILAPWRRNLRVVQQAPLAVYNFMCLEGHDSESSVVVDMGGRTTGVVVIDPPEFWLRSLLVGGDTLTERIEAHFGVSRREAERIKERAGESGRAAQLLRVVGKPLGNILSEIQRSLGYYKSLSPDVRFDKVIGVGNAFRLKGLDRVIGEGLQSRVEVLRDVKNVNLTASVKNEIGDGLCGCCALFGVIAQCAGLGRIAVNLVPEEIAFENQMRGKKPFLVGAVAAIVAVLVVLITGEMLYGRRVEAHADAGRGIPEELNEVREDYTRMQRRTRDFETELQQLSSRNVRRDILLHVLPELTRALPREREPASDALLPSAVYIRDIKFHWVSMAEYQRLLAGEAVPDARTDEFRRRDVRVEEEERRARPEEAARDMVAGKDAVLVMEALCESTVTYRARMFLDSTIEALRGSRYETGVPVFSEVRRVGPLEGIRRDMRTGEIVADPDALEFIQFRIVAGVNDIGGTAFAAGESSEERPR